MTTVALSAANKKGLDKWKVHPREPYDEVITRLLEIAEASKKK